MGVYIKGMEMPTAPVLFCIHPDGKVFADLEGGWREYKAIPVPSHGDLIDADWVRNDIDKKRPGRSYEDAWALTVIDAAPTIIEADPAEEGE